MRAVRFGTQARFISGVAPVLHFPSATPAPGQKQNNTARALEVIRAQLGEKPAPYTRKYTATFEQIKEEIDNVLSSCGSDEAPLEDGKEVTKMQVIERVLRHGLVQYQKNEGVASYEDIEKWLVYTAQDQMEFAKMKRDAELQEKLKAFRSSTTTVPNFDWAAEYSSAIDREVVAEKRKRYDQVAATSFERDEEAIEALLREYKDPVQAKALDQLVDQINMFKPFLAKQVVQAKLIERNAVGQLTYSRFADFNPDARDLSDLEAAADMINPATPDEPLSLGESEKRYADVRMKTKEEVISTMESIQQQAATSSSGASAGADETRRAKMLADILRIQSRATTDSDKTEGASEKTAEEKEAEAEAARIAKEKEMERFRVSDAVVKEKGLLGLNFMSEASA